MRRREVERMSVVSRLLHTHIKVLVKVSFVGISVGVHDRGSYSLSWNGLGVFGKDRGRYCSSKGRRTGVD